MKRGRRFLCLVPALLVAVGCGDPMPADVQWLAGNWRWAESCCTIAGASVDPSSSNELFIDFHHNGDVEMVYHGDTVRTRFDVDIGDQLIQLRFLQPLPILHPATTFLVERIGMDRIALKEYPTFCTDCPDRHGFVRIQ